MQRVVRNTYDNGEVGYSLYLTRGDTGRFDFVTKVGGAETPLGEKDQLTFTVKRSTTTGEILIQKVLVGSGDVVLDPVDTDGLPYGSYRFDVQIDTAAGDRLTVVDPRRSRFILTDEVTF